MGEKEEAAKATSSSFLLFIRSFEKSIFFVPSELDSVIKKSIKGFELEYGPWLSFLGRDDFFDTAVRQLTYYLIYMEPFYQKTPACFH